MSQEAPADGLPITDTDAAPPDSRGVPEPAGDKQPPEDDAAPPMDGSGPQELDEDEL